MIRSASTLPDIVPIRTASLVALDRNKYRYLFSFTIKLCGRCYKMLFTFNRIWLYPIYTGGFIL